MTSAIKCCKKAALVRPLLYLLEICNKHATQYAKNSSNINMRMIQIALRTSSHLLQMTCRPLAAGDAISMSLLRFGIGIRWDA